MSRGRFDGYTIEPLTKIEYDTLCWLAERGYDGGILKAGGADELPDGGAIIGPIPEHKAWEITDTIEADPRAFLASNGSSELARKLHAFLDQVV